MPDFSAQSKFNANKNYTEIKFGADAPLLEVELNELQQIQNNARAELVRQSIHSGFTSLATIGYLSTTANQIKLNEESVAFVNGYQIKIPAGTVITLPAPPTFGTRDDLVFLEAWFEEIDSKKDTAIKDSRIGVETSRRIKLNWRIRTVAGVDFNTYPEGLGNLGTALYNMSVTPQGGNATPLTIDQTKAIISSYSKAFFRNAGNSAVVSEAKLPALDTGLYVAGDGSQAFKDAFKTADGYVYAIPLFRVKRRNNAGYREDNLNGARDYFITTTATCKDFPSTVKPGEVNTLPLESNIYNSIKVGDILCLSTFRDAKIKVLSKDGNNTITFKNIGSVTIYGISNYWMLVSDRPDGKYANIIDKDDIIDLRHQVSLTGFNYQKLLEENFDKLLRGELQTKDKPVMKKERFNLVPAPQGLKQELVPVAVVGNDGVTRNLVNLLGEDGNCEDTGRWSYIGNNASLDSSNFLYGTKSIKLTSISNHNIMKKQMSNLKVGGYYLLAVNFKGDSSSVEWRLVFNNSDITTSTVDKYVDITCDGTWKFAYFKFSPTVHSPYVGMYRGGTDSGVSGYVDGFRVYEIDQDTYNKIDVDPAFTGEELAKKFPYVDSYPNIVENLLKDNGFVPSGYSFEQGFLFNGASTITNNSTKVLKVTQYNSYGGAGQLIKVPRGSNVTVSAIRRNDTPTNIRITEVLSEADSIAGRSTPNQRRFVAKSLDKNVRQSVTFYNVQTEYVIVTIDGGYITSPQEIHVEDITVEVGSTPAFIYVPYGRWFLPHDYASGQVPTNFTRINGHRGIVSDAQISVVKTDIVEALKTPQSHIKVTQATEGRWSAGDTIQITSNEGVITGVIDSNTALAKVLDGNEVNPTTIKVDGVSKLSVNDKIRIVYLPDGSYTAEKTITAVDTVNNTITIDSPTGWNTINSAHVIVETTTSTFVPTVTATGIAGTWSGLGTKQATFTITTPPTNNTDPIKIDYSISYPAGQGISEVPMEVYEASVNGQRLVKASDSIVRVKANFEGKVAFSADLVPHKYFHMHTNTLQTLNGTWYEIGYQDEYDGILKLDGTVKTTTSSTNGDIAQQRFSFDLIRLMEDKFGEGFFADCVTTADKVNKLKSVITKITPRWYGYGTSPTGNKAKLEFWNGSAWSLGWAFHSSSTVALLTNVINSSYITTSQPTFLQNGFIHFLVHADPSDGTTASTIYTDYVELEVEINVAETGYDVLVPENPFPKLNENLIYSNDAFPVDVSKFTAYGSANNLSLYEPGTVQVTLNAMGDGLGQSGCTDDRYDVLGNKDYTYQVEVFVTNPTTVYVYTWDNYVIRNSPTITLEANKWTKITHKLRTSSNANKLEVAILVPINGSPTFTAGTVLRMRKMKLQEGTIATTWKPGRKKKTVLNFLGKVAGSTLENKNKLYNKFDTTFGAPSTFTNEQTQTAYDNIGKQDGVLNTLTTNGTGQYAQELYEFDLSTLGLSLSELKKALRKLTVTWVGYGKGDNAGVVGYGVKLKGYDGGAPNPPQWWDLTSSTSSTPTTLSFNNFGVVKNFIDKNMKVYILAHTTYPAGTGSASELYTDYIKLEVELADYVDYVKSNVVKVRKETKEVNLQYPAKSYRSGILDAVELWYKYVPFQGLHSNYATILDLLDYILVTTHGTGGVMNSNMVGYFRAPMIPAIVNLPNALNNPIAQEIQPYSFTSKGIAYAIDDSNRSILGSIDIPYARVPIIERWLFEGYSCVGQKSDSLPAFIGDDLKKQLDSYLCVTAGLVEYNGELLMRVRGNVISGSKYVITGGTVITSAVCDYKIQGSPLVKGV